MKSFKIFRKFVSYSFAGLLGFAIDMTIVKALHLMFVGKFTFFIVLFGYATGSVISFLILNHFVFTNSKRKLSGRATYFSVTATTKAILISFLTSLLEKNLPFGILIVRLMAGIPVATFFFFVDNYVSFKNEIK